MNNTYVNINIYNKNPHNINDYWDNCLLCGEPLINNKCPYDHNDVKSKSKFRNIFTKCFSKMRNKYNSH